MSSATRDSVPPPPSRLIRDPGAAAAYPALPMGTWLLLALTAALLGTGCAQTYIIRLNNGQTLTAATRPKPDGHGYYVFKDGDGQEVKVKELRVREIEAK